MQIKLTFRHYNRKSFRFLNKCYVTVWEALFGTTLFDGTSTTTKCGDEPDDDSAFTCVFAIVIGRIGRERRNPETEKEAVLGLYSFLSRKVA